MIFSHSTLYYTIYRLILSSNTSLSSWRCLKFSSPKILPTAYAINLYIVAWFSPFEINSLSPPWNALLAHWWGTKEMIKYVEISSLSAPNANLHKAQQQKQKKKSVKERKRGEGREREGGGAVCRCQGQAYAHLYRYRCRYSWRDTAGDAGEMLGRCCMYMYVCMYIEGIVLIDTTGTYAAGANCAALGSFSSSLPAVASPSLVWLPLDITVSLPLLPLAASPCSPFLPHLLFWLQSAVLALDLWPTATLVRQTLWPSAASHATSARDKRSSFSCLLPPPPLPSFLFFSLLYLRCRGKKPIKCTLYSLALPPWLLNSVLCKQIL